MQTLTHDHLNHISGAVALTREQEIGMLTIAVGIATRGYWLPMSAVQLADGAYHDFQSHVRTGPTGPSTNHLTTRQYRLMKRQR